ncbi:MAG TPA: hypothetical protein VNI20_11495 [Fimbriimonadaceae bacterium]|nr:hypothetical protein [Fimbriimonadaceae bacterium]
MDKRETAKRFANGLDHERYDDVASCLSNDCEYTIGGETHAGPQAIIASYRTNGAWAKQNIDEIEYESEVSMTERGATIDFTDCLTHRGARHTHRCRQHLEFDGQARINRITHEDLPGEKEALDAFFKDAGIDRQT